ncbi:MAG TPA: nicotinate-nucleotide diphosphorylase, partial [Actinobacteria bacterium]|nr:nicotinate-nucleotide diphosphorylase [Actinomycetota bacterium]
YFFNLHAVKLGGRFNHRLGLFESFLIKDNHLVNLDLAAAVETAKAANIGPVEVEVETLDQLEQAIGAGADIVLLDNMEIEKIVEAIAIAKGKLEIEVSGGVNLDNVFEIAEAGPDRISTSAITQQAPAIDFSITVASRENV